MSLNYSFHLIFVFPSCFSFFFIFLFHFHFLLRSFSFLACFLTFVYCGSLASVHNHMPAYPSRVFASCSTPQRMLFFWLKSASTVLRACCQLFDCPCRIDHVVVDWTCWTSGLLVGFALQPARVPSYSATREDAQPRPEPGICGCGPCVCGGPSALNFSGQRLLVKGRAYLYIFIVLFAIGVCACLTLNCTIPPAIVTHSQKMFWPPNTFPGNLLPNPKTMPNQSIILGQLPSGPKES